MIISLIRRVGVGNWSETYRNHMERWRQKNDHGNRDRIDMRADGQIIAFFLARLIGHNQATEWTQLTLAIHPPSSPLFVSPPPLSLSIVDQLALDWLIPRWITCLGPFSNSLHNESYMLWFKFTDTDYKLYFNGNGFLKQKKFTKPYHTNISYRSYHISYHSHIAAR